MMELAIKFIILTLLVCHTGIAWQLMLMPGKILDRLAPKIERIKILFIRDLLSCVSCISGQFAFWNAIWIMYWTGKWEWAGVACMWVMMVIVLTDQLNRKYGYS